MDKELIIIICVCITIVIVAIAVLIANGKLKLKQLKAKGIELDFADNEPKSEPNAQTTQPSPTELKSIDGSSLYKDLILYFEKRMYENHIVPMENEQYAAYIKSNINQIINIIKPYYEHVTLQEITDNRSKIEEYFTTAFLDLKQQCSDFEAANHTNVEDLYDQITYYKHCHDDTSLDVEILYKQIRTHTILTYNIQMTFLRNRMYTFIYIFLLRLLQTIDPKIIINND